MLNKYSKNEKVQDFEPTRLSLEDKLKKKVLQVQDVRRTFNEFPKPFLVDFKTKTTLI